MDTDSDNFTTDTVDAVANSFGSPANALTAGQSEDTAGVEGLVNINTASWKVLSMIPWVPRGTDNITDAYGQPDGVDDNINIARAIVAWRAANGPFASIGELYNVPAFRLENDRLITAGNTAALLGDNPGSGKTIPFDFRQRFLLLDRASNLNTTRSDTFTCYLLLQGWRNAGTPNATLAVQRRAAFYADRSTVTPANTRVATFKVLSD